MQQCARVKERRAVPLIHLEDARVSHGAAGE